MRILILSNTLSDSDMVYNGFALPYAERYAVGYVTYFPPTLAPDPRIQVYSGGGTVRGTLQAIRQAVQDGYDVFHVHSAHMAALLVAAVGWRLPRYWKRTVYTVHTSYPNLKLRNKLLTAVAFVCLRKIVFCSYASRASFPRLVVWALGGRALVVQNGVDIQRIDRAMRREP